MQPADGTPRAVTLPSKAQEFKDFAIPARAPRSLVLEVARVLGMDDGTRRALEDLVRGAATRKTAVAGRFVADEGVSRMLAGHGICEDVPEVDFHRFERVVIPRCGVALQDKRRWERDGVPLEDLTSAEVRRAQVSLALLRVEGAKALVIGRHDDAESRALAGSVPGARILEETTDTARLEFAPAFGAVCQTTLSPRRVHWISQQLHMRWRDARVTFLDTTSPAMKAREEALEQILPRCEHVIIVGQAGEATAEALLETALRRGLPAHRVEGPEELDGIDLGGATRIAFSAGGFASDGAVRAVAAALKTRRPQL
ncbi:MAG: hypothetical protein H7A49_15175 [Akkermansiaceae bacterium]|nr:hypothetical protein [Akkermansiaceae bacterium]MCP5549071.1 hypothetical protein [Akkermansiaceae bacterium]